MSRPPTPTPCPLGEAVAALQVAMQLQPHGNTPGQKRPGCARHPSCEHVGGPMHPEIEPTEPHEHG